jgi:aminoglycoside 6-adenylyltransferase
LIELGKSTDQIKTGIIIGSKARTEQPADEYSDIDIILLVDDIEFFMQSDEWY